MEHSRRSVRSWRSSWVLHSLAEFALHLWRALTAELSPPISVNRPSRSCWNLAHPSGLKVLKGLSELGLCVHDEWSVPGHRLSDRRAAQ